MASFRCPDNVLKSALPNAADTLHSQAGRIVMVPNTWWVGVVTTRKGDRMNVRWCKKTLNAEQATVTYTMEFDDKNVSVLKPSTLNVMDIPSSFVDTVEWNDVTGSQSEFTVSLRKHGLEQTDSPFPKRSAELVAKPARQTKRVRRQPQRTSADSAASEEPEAAPPEAAPPIPLFKTTTGTGGIVAPVSRCGHVVKTPLETAFSDLPAGLQEILSAAWSNMQYSSDEPASYHCVSLPGTYGVSSAVILPGGLAIFTAAPDDRGDAMMVHPIRTYIGAF